MLIHNAQVTGSLILNGIDIGDITGSEVSIGALNSFSASVNIYTGSNNTNINALQTFSSSILTYTASNDTTNNTQNSRLSSLETTSGSLLTASGSFSTRVSNTETTSSNLTTASSSFSTRVANNEATGSGLVAASASFSTRVANTEATASSLTTASGSFSTRTTNLETASGSFSTRVTNNESNISSLTTASGSFSTRTTNLETASGSFSTRVTNAESNITSLNSKTGSYATTGSNIFVGAQYISNISNAISFTSTGSLYTDGGMRVAKDMYVSGTAYFNNVTVFGTQSIAYISSSQLNIGTNIISVNTDTPSIRFGGLSVYDSGSTGLTGSMLWDSEDNQWIYSNPSGSTYDSAVFLVGPRNSGAIGSEVGISCNFLSKGNGLHHMTSSGIFEDGSKTCFYGTTVIGSGGTISSPTIYGSTTVCGATICSSGNSYTANASIVGGCIGIGGTFNPTNPLHIYGDSNTCFAAMKVQNASACCLASVGIEFQLLTDFVDYKKAEIRAVASEQYANSIDLAFWSGGSTAAKHTERLRITSDGISCFACQVCAPSFIGGTISGTTIYGSTAVCSPVGKFTTCIDAGSGIFSSCVKSTRYLIAPSGVSSIYNFVDSDQLFAGSYNLQAGGGSSGYGGSLVMFGHSHATKPGYVVAGISAGSGGKFTVNNAGNGGGTELFTVDVNGVATFSSTITGTTIYGSTAICSPAAIFSGCVGIGTTSAYTSRLNVQSSSPSVAAIKAGYGAVAGNGYTVLADNYTLTESLIAIGVDYSSGGLVLGSIMAPSTTNQGCFISTQAQFGGYGSAIRLNTSGEIYFYNGTQNSVISTGNAKAASIALTIANTGCVGIGTCAPNAKLTVWTPSTTGLQTALRLNNPFGFNNLNTGAQIVFSQDRSVAEDLQQGIIAVGQADAGTSATSFMAFYTNNTGLGERLRITSTGVACFATTVCAPSFYTSTNSYLTRNTLRLRSANDAKYLDIQTTNTCNIISSNYGDSDIPIILGSYSGHQVNQLFLSTNCNVGIGTSTPCGKIQVSLSTVSGGCFRNAVGGEAALTIEASGNSYIQFMNNSSSQTGIMFGNNCLQYSGMIWYRHDQKQLMLGANNTEIMYLCGGNVGIGTPTPTEILHLNSGNTAAFIRFANTGGNGTYLGSRNANMEIYVGGSEKLRITSDGSFAIGTTAPRAILSVEQDYAATAEFGSQGQLSISGKTNPEKRLSMGFNTSADVGFIQAMVNGVSYNNLLLNARGGNVGIGTASPSYLLDISGPMRAGTILASNATTTTWCVGRINDAKTDCWYSIFGWNGIYDGAFAIIQLGYEDNNGDGANTHALWMTTGAAYSTGFSTSLLGGAGNLCTRRNGQCLEALITGVTCRAGGAFLGFTVQSMNVAS